MPAPWLVGGQSRGESGGIEPARLKRLKAAVGTEPVSSVAGSQASGLILLCDHASNAFPPDLGTLGLPASELERHIAYDIGAAGVTRGMAARLGAPAVLSCYSRLVIDCNRGMDDPTLIMRLSDGAIVAGNRHIDDRERQRRTAAYYAPYHAAIDREIDNSLAAGIVPVLVSIHTFTPIWRGVARPWHCGVLWDRDQRLSTPLIEALRANGDLVVGDNEPYTGHLEGDCMSQHGTRRGLPHALIEIRQDLVADADGEDAWAARLSGIITAIFADATRRRALQTQLVGPNTLG